MNRFFPDHPLCLISLEFYGEIVRKRESRVRVREKRQHEENDLFPFNKITTQTLFIFHPPPTYLSRSTSVQFNRSGMRILCVLLYFLHIFGFVTNGNFSFFLS